MEFQTIYTYMAAIQCQGGAWRFRAMLSAMLADLQAAAR